ncbi:MAG TPA: S9 family peptidase [Steroidobacteraceae bacterium]|nr:S9 family peptidase [Steroidobacteraceae bacterium]HRX88786.1 S9 family peptidase [Steroidobacteraceae bacterium]
MAGRNCFRSFIVCLALSLPLVAAAQTDRAPFTAQDLVAMKRVSDPQTSPDGRYVAFVLRETDLAANRGRTDIWLLDLQQKDAQPRQLTRDPANDSDPRWGSDSRTIWFVSARSGTSQVWRLSLDGGEAVQITDLPLDVAAVKPSPDGKSLALSMEVFPDCKDLQCTKDRLTAKEKSKETGLLFDKLFVRHWDTWRNGTRANLFTVVLGADGRAGTPVNVSATLDADVPSKPFGGDDVYTWSPDSQRLVVSARVAGRTEPWSTNFDLFEVAANGSTPPVNLTADNPAWDTQPMFLANGDLAWLAMQRPGFEADRFQVMLRDSRGGAPRALTAGWDRSVSHLGRSGDGRSLLATADDIGQVALFRLDPKSGTRTRLVQDGQVTGFSPTETGIVISWASLGAPNDLYWLSGSDAPQRLTNMNADMLAARSMAEYEQFSFAGAADAKVYGYVMKPHGYQAGQKYPIAFIVHGGPQSSFANSWSWRWNPQVYAGRGYAVVFIDFHGSTGYGQAFTDAISGDWGGKPLVDLQRGLAAALQQYPWLDGERACSLGASYGGYMQNWIAGQWPDRFRCIVNHDGIFDNRMMYYTTEELWFPEWEHGGPQFEKPEAYEKFNPVNHVTKWRTPMLVIHGARDYRVPDTQSLAAFTALQRRGIESKLLYFPDENHWVLKPANSLQWHDTVLDWLDRYLK